MNSATRQADAFRTPSLDDVFAAASQQQALRLRVCMPAKVVEVHGPQHVDVLPLLRQRVRDVVLDYPVVTGALVCMPVGGDFRLSWALKPGDTGVMLCADRSLDAYAASDGTTPVDPADARAHQLTDAIFIPGLLPHAKQTEATDDMVLANGRAVIRLDKAGKFSIGNGATDLLAQVQMLSQQVSDLAKALSTATSTAPGGPLDGGTIASAIKASSASSAIQNAIKTLSQGG